MSGGIHLIYHFPGDLNESRCCELRYCFGPHGNKGRQEVTFTPYNLGTMVSETRTPPRSACFFQAPPILQPWHGIILAALLPGFGLSTPAQGDDRPEPMVFDLVDPLGAPKGELEINTLMDFVPRTGKLEWQPEIEYAFADGYAAEFELPLENSTVQQY